MASCIMSIRLDRQPGCSRGGFTLAEAMLAVVVLGIASAGVLLPFTSGASVRAEGMRRMLGGKLCSDMIEQILVEPFDDIVGDYDGYSEAEGQVKDATGAVFADVNYSRFSRDVSCDYVYVAQESGTTSAMFILVSVEVHYAGREVAVINRLISR